MCGVRVEYVVMCTILQLRSYLWVATIIANQVYVFGYLWNGE
ncbi:hypothetical protein HanPI659440_Chr16g0658731 [Helianthus annuus]|nr:hypothetical protein HanHA300_Chr16g0632461 [Helianthus annuus]KAJ0683480.1 hypothetical protein HanPI659440_Chr16g0658731 [Helianthus annuus]